MPLNLAPARWKSRKCPYGHTHHREREYTACVDKWVRAWTAKRARNVAKAAKRKRERERLRKERKAIVRGFKL